MTMALGLHNEVLLAALQHFFLASPFTIVGNFYIFSCRDIEGIKSVVCGVSVCVSNSLQLRKTIYSLLFFLFLAHHLNI